MKEQTEKNPESPKVAEIEAAFAEVGKTPHGEVLASVFQDNTLAKTWEIKYDDMIYGRSQEEENSSGMVLTKYPSGSRAAVGLRIFRNKWRAEDRFGDVDFYVMSRDGEIRMDIIQDFSLTAYPEYFDYVMKIIGEIRTKVSQIPKKDETRNFSAKPTPGVD